jgi:hypothetical protein
MQKLSENSRGYWMSRRFFLMCIISMLSSRFVKREITAFEFDGHNNGWMIKGIDRL